MPYVRDSFAATGPGTPISVQNGVLEISGTFSGTVQLYIDVVGDGTYAPAMDASGTPLSLTQPGVLNIANGAPVNCRAQCTAYASGAIVASIRGF
jgi:hypothetical protein